MNKNNLPVMVVMVMVVVVVMVCHGDALGDLQVSSDSKYCSQHPTFLSCDFLGAKELVVLGSLGIKRGGQTVNTVYVHNTEELRVENNVCVSLVAFNVANITHDGNPRTCEADHIFSFKLVDSYTDSVPSYVSHLDMQRSGAHEVTINRDLRSFVVMNSDIGRLKVTKAVSGVRMKMEHSLIDYLEKVYLENKSQFTVFNSTINSMAKSGIRITESSMTIWIGSIKTSVDQAVVLGHRGSLTIKDTDGRLTLAGTQDMPAPTSTVTKPKDEGRRPPGVPQTVTKPTQPNHCHSSFIWIPPTVLALLEAVVIVVNCTHWFPSLRGRPKRGLEEGGSVRRRQNEDSPRTSYSSLYYNTEIKGINRRQNMEYYDKYS